MLNAVLNEDSAIVSDIAGTTRDTIEETLNINGVLFRLVDTAGIREHSTDRIENLGIERSKQNAEKADIIIHLVDMTDREEHEFGWLNAYAFKTIIVNNKLDEWQAENEKRGLLMDPVPGFYISAKHRNGIEMVKKEISRKAIGEEINTENTIVTNARHQDALEKISESINAIEQGMRRAR